MEKSEPLASGQGVRASSLQQQPEQKVLPLRPQRQLHKNILGVLGRRAAQGTGTWRWKPNLVLGKVVPVVWCEAAKWAAFARQYFEEAGERWREVVSCFI